MEYDINSCRFSGKVSALRELNTKSGIAMASFRIQSWKEEVRCVCFREIANTILSEVSDGDQIEVRGQIQSSNWEKDGQRFFGYQLNVQEIVANGNTYSGEEDKPKQQTIYEDDVTPPRDDNDYSGGPF